MASKLRKLLGIALKHHGKIGLLGYVAGIVWFIALVHPSLNARTYFSENALLPGMVETQYQYGRDAKSLKAEVENPSQDYRDNFPLWLMNKMSAVGLESYQQNFTVQISKDLSILNEVTSGSNIYGILRAPRTARTEALVFSIPMKSGKSEPFYELVLLLSLAEHFRNNIYWAKDIIFLVVDQNEIGTLAWLDEYYGVQSDYVKSSRMLGRSGAIQAAINLEVDNQDFSQMQILIEGLNGQLPNLDLVNMVHKLCQDAGIPATLKQLPIRYFNDGWDEYRSSLSTLASMMFNQASGRPTANHGLFLKYGIEAVTLRGVKERGGSSVGFAKLGRALEGMFRSLNSLLERFHQSFFFYLLSSTSRYISIGLYMPPLGCLLIGPALAAVACWVSSGEEQDKMQKDETISTETTAGLEKEKKDIAKEEFAFIRVPRHFGKVLGVVLAGYFICLIVYLSPCMLWYIPVTSFDLQLVSFLLVVVIGILLFYPSLPLFLRLTNNMKNKDWLLLKSVALVIYICLVGCLATVNFSFGFFLAIFATPACIFVCSTQNRLQRLIQVSILFLCSPPSVLFIMVVIYSYLTSDDYHATMHNAKNMYMNSLLASLRDSILMGTWFYPVSLLVVAPNWLLFWCIAWM